MTPNKVTNTLEGSDRIITVSAESYRNEIEDWFVMEALRVSCFTAQLSTNDRSTDFCFIGKKMQVANY